MANTRDIRRRITSITNTRQITRAMEMVAATKMRRAQQAVLDSREYADRAESIFTAISRTGEKLDAPLLERRPVKRIGVVWVGSDRGLCGALNTNVLRHLQTELASVNKPVSYVTMGRKPEQAVRILSGESTASFTGLKDLTEYPEVIPAARTIIEEFTAGRLDEVYLAYPKFVSTLRNQPVFTRLLPAVADESAGQEAPEVSALTQFEPSPEAVLESLLPRLVEIRLWQALLETKASEHSARMMTMRNATTNAGDLLDELKFTYNQARQAAITTEIAEIASAAELAQK